MRRNYIFVFILFVMASCSKDLGNYEYKGINTYTVTGINTGPGIERNYDVLMGQTLKITPQIEDKFKDNSPDLSYYWILEKDTISKERNLDYIIDIPIKVYQGKFVLVDNKTGMNYITVFALNVTSPFGRGYFFLAEDEKHNTILSFKAVGDDSKDIVTTDNMRGIPFGKYPKNMAGVKAYRSGPQDYSWRVFLVSGEGQYPVLFADLTSYSPIKYFTKESFMGTWGNEFQFKPSHVSLKSAGVTYFINNGRVALFDNSNMYRPSQLFDGTPDYKLDDMLIGDINRFNGARSLIGFDLISSRFKVVTRYPQSDPVKGIVYNSNILDRMVDIPAPEGITDGHKVLGSASFYIPATGYLTSKVVTVKGSNLNLISFDVPYSAGTPFLPAMRILNTQNVPGVTADSKMTVFENMGGYAYVSAGNKIMRSNFVDGTFVEFVSVPSEFGEITALKYQINSVNSATPRLFISTYDKNSTSENKGSILIYDVDTRTVIHQFKHVTGKVIDIFLAE